MNRNEYEGEQRGYSPYRESDSYDEPRFDTDGTFTHSNFSFETRRPTRFSRPNRYGERNIRHDSYQDDQFHDDYDPTYQDEYGMKHPYEHGGRENRWSDDIRSEASRESHYGKGPRGYRRSDERIFEEACDLLTNSPAIDASDIDVEVSEGCIYLKGEVYTRRDKRLAEDLMDRISGVRDVWNQLKIKKSYDGWHEELEGPVKGLY